MTGTQHVDKNYMQIKNMRLAKGWSQEELAAISGVSTRTVQRIEKGHPPGLETLKSLAAAFETDIETLNTEKDMPQVIDANANHTAEAEQNRRGLKLHLWTYAIMLSVLTALNLFLTPGDWWILWVAGAWSVGVVLHILTVRIMYGD
jgi:transcriptional regulator with XRE-family HTH domain